MTYIEVDWDWVETQLKAVHANGTPVGDAVNSLLEVIEVAGFKNTQVNEVTKALDYVKALIQGYPIYLDTSEERWVDVRGGDLSVRDTVRVKPDAYTGSAGVSHNGKRGRVVAMRNGKITVLLDGDPVENSKTHEIHSLQKLDVK